MLPNTQPIQTNNWWTRTKLISKSLWFGIDWAWNPTHTNSAILAVESFLNQKNDYPNLQALLDSNPETSKVFSSPEFTADMSQTWDFDNLVAEYPQGSLAVEYVEFMKKLCFKP